MNVAHQIRLHGPWQLYVRESSDIGDRVSWVPIGRFRAPAGLGESIPGDYHGPAVLERSFHRPTGLDDRSRLRLVYDTNLEGSIALNGQSLGSLRDGDQACEITPWVQTRNRLKLTVTIDAAADMRQLYCDVRLQILEPSE